MHVKALLDRGVPEAKIKETLYQQGADIISVGEVFRAIKASHSIEKPKKSWKIILEYLLIHPYLIVLAGVLFFTSRFLLEGHRGAVFAILLVLILVQILLYAFTIYIIDLMFQAEGKKVSIYIWLSLAINACFVVPYSGWVFQSIILYFALKEDISRVITFVIAAAIMKIAFGVINPIFINMIS